MYYNRARYLDPATGRCTTQDPLGYAAGDVNLYRYVGNMATMATDPSGNLIFVPVLVVGGAALAVAGIAGLHYSAHRYDYAREHYLSRPIPQWTPELQAEFRDYVRTTDWIAAGSEVAGWTGISMVAAGAISGLCLRPAVAPLTPYQIASQGGRHAGFLRNYIGRTPAEIQKAIASLEARAPEHAAKAANPAAHVADWASRSPQAQQGLIRYWLKEAQIYSEQAAVLRGLLRSLRGRR